MRFCVKRAEKGLFAVYQTIYSNSDTEMWYDWAKRLGDTDFTDGCYFLMEEERKIGGFICHNGNLSYPFLIPPFSDRFAFWSFLVGEYEGARVYGVLDEDYEILRMFGYRCIKTGQVMVRPADRLDRRLADGFLCRDVVLEKDRQELCAVMCEAYRNTIITAIDGPCTPESAEEDINYVFKAYDVANFSKAVIDTATGKMAGFCLSGMFGGVEYAEIYSLCVLPAYQKRGLAQHMLARALTQAQKTAPFVKLLVYVGNQSQHVYHRMGFLAGPRFHDMRPDGGFTLS